MVGHLLLRGMLVGVVAGLLAFGFARLFGEPPIERAIAFEAQTSSQGGQGHSHSHDHSAHDHPGHDHAGDHADHSDHAKAEPEAELVARSTQAGLGLLTGTVVYGAAIGGLFALAFAFVHGRIGDQSPRATAALLALAGFVAIVLVPAIKYPANPPAVGDPATIGSRTALYFVMLALSVVVLAAAIALARRLQTRFGAWNAALIAGAAFIVVTALVYYALPAVNEVPDRFSAVVLWRFRVASLGMHLVLWATIGLLFGFLSERATARRQA
jgi:predicted cobalt transporter CbtA